MRHFCGTGRGVRKPQQRLARGGSGAETARRLEDATYTLCVVTGTRQLDAALFMARRQLADSLARHQPLHPSG
ncbi:hypothetical protein AV521_04845 [Streptomyces sp. IMTB 2501]|nr:hypothetical protein AV521_04845 [Streptomyces sp. IMTB 2501]